MDSQFLNHLSLEERSALVKQLHGMQNGHCFICEKDIDLEVQKATLDIDHVVPLKAAGKNDASNLTLTHK